MLTEARRMTVDELTTRMTDARRRHRRCEYELSCLLLAFDEAGGAHSAGHIDTVGFAYAVLGLERRQTIELLRIAHALPELPHLHGAFAEGRLGWTQVREAVRVAVPETDEAWTERALAVSCRRLEREVSASGVGALPPDPDDEVALPDRVVLRFELSAGDALVVRKALAVLKAQAGEDDAADEGVLLAALARVALRASDTPDLPMPEERYRVVLEQCQTCLRSTHVGQEDGLHLASDAVVAEAECDHETVDGRPGPTLGHLTHAIPPAVRRAIMHRDRYRCAVPGCANHTWCDVHHLVPRSEGGDHAASNLAVLCTLHHRQVHEHRLRLTRGADGALHVERDAPDPPLLVALLDVLDACVLDTDEVARYLGVTEAEARAVLERHERRGAVVRTNRGAWGRLTFAGAA